MSKVIFTYESKEIVIPCEREDKMRDICIKLGTKIEKDINNLYYLYNAQVLENLDLKYKEIINVIDNNRNEMNILVFEKENEGIKCPNCGHKLIIDINNDNNIKDSLIDLKVHIQNIINSTNNDINNIIFQLKNINIIIDNIIQQFNKNNKEIKIINHIPNQNINQNINKNIIEGIININNNNINQDILLYNSKEKIDVYINNQKINNNTNKYKFSNPGNYSFKYIFHNPTINNLNGFFSGCKDIISLDLSNLNTTNVTDMSFMFNECHKLKEIKGINIICQLNIKLI